MRCLVVGVDDVGRSCVLREGQVDLTELAPGLHVGGLFRTKDSPPRPRPEGRGDLIDLGVAPGQCAWSLWRFDPGAEVGMHHTDTVDFDIILDGSVELILDDGVHVLEAGDCVVMNGADHAWRAGSAGCLTSAVALGSQRRE